MTNSKFLLILHLDWKIPNIREVITIFRSALKNKSDLIRISLYEKKDKKNFNFNGEYSQEENLENNNPLKKTIGVAEFKNTESALEVYETLNDFEIYELTFDLRFLSSLKLFEDLHEIYTDDYDDLFMLEFTEDNVDEYIDYEGSSSFDYNELLKDYKDDEIQFCANNKDEEKENDEKFEANLEDGRFKEFYDNKNFAVDKTLEIYSKNKNIDKFVEEKEKRDEN